MFSIHENPRLIGKFPQIDRSGFLRKFRFRPIENESVILTELLHRFRDVNTESPAWAIDRLSILALKIYHMQEQVDRADASDDHRQRCQLKLDVLLEQQKDLSTAIDQLLEDIEAGRIYMKVYRQMKMYNDPSTNPILYQKK